MISKKKIREKIRSLTEERKKIPEVSMFGTKNWEIIDGQIKALKDCLVRSEGKIKLEVKKIQDEYDETADEWDDNQAEEMMERTKPYEWVLEVLSEDAF